MMEQRVIAAVRKYTMRLLLPGILVVLLSDVLSKYFFGIAISPVLIFIVSFVLATYSMQKVLIEVLASDSTSR